MEVKEVINQITKQALKEANLKIDYLWNILYGIFLNFHKIFF